MKDNFQDTNKKHMGIAFQELPPNCKLLAFSLLIGWLVDQ